MTLRQFYKKKDIKMHALLFNLLLPLGVSILKQYIESSSSKKDDLVLSTVKTGCYYLAAKDNNSLDLKTADKVSSSIITEELY